MKHKFTIGIEEEYQIVDLESRELQPQIHKIIESGRPVLEEMIQAEMHEAMVEGATGVCETVGEATNEIRKIRKELIKVATAEGLGIAAAGTHPFSLWYDQTITDKPRYDSIVDEMQDAARSNIIFGMHVHIGIPNREEGLRMSNIARYFLPHIFAISTNSPFWNGRNTGFKSYRSKVFDKYPRTGIPPNFSSLSEHDDFIKMLIKTNCIDVPNKIWWDLRLHPYYPTIEFRICDIPLTIKETACIAALCQAISAKIYKLHQQNQDFRTYRRAFISENKWRAARWGIGSKLVDYGKERERPFQELVIELLLFIDDVVDDLGCRKEIEYVHEIMKNGTGADRQLAVWNKNKCLKEVVDYIIQETANDL